MDENVSLSRIRRVLLGETKGARENTFILYTFKHRSFGRRYERVVLHESVPRSRTDCGVFHQRHRDAVLGEFYLTLGGYDRTRALDASKPQHAMLSLVVIAANRQLERSRSQVSKLTPHIFLAVFAEAAASRAHIFQRKRKAHRIAIICKRVGAR